MIKSNKLREAVRAHYEGFILIVVLAGILAIAVLVRYRLSFLNFFFLPVILAGYYLGKRKSVLVAVLSVLLVVLYVLFQGDLSGDGVRLSFEEVTTLVTWAGFLILTGGLLGSMAEQGKSKLRNMRRAYTGVMSILLQYLEVADEADPRSVRIARLAGRLAGRMGLSRREVENVKTAALLCGAGDLDSSMSLFVDAAEFMEIDAGSGPQQTDRERVLLKTTAALLGDIRPLLEGYFRNYVQDAGTTEKNLGLIPVGSSLIALAEVFDKLKTQGAARIGTVEIRSFGDLLSLKGRSFPEPAVMALSGEGD